MAGVTTFTQQKADEICKQIADGKSLRSICADDSMPCTDTVLKWLIDIEGFSAQYAHARELQMELMASEIIEIAEESPMMTITFGESGEKTCLDNAGIQRNRLRVDTRKWLMSKLAPKKYGDRVTQEVTGKDGGPVEFVTKSILEE
jgi:uncharacterized protein YodC (DUF2158 family)